VSAEQKPLSKKKALKCIPEKNSLVTEIRLESGDLILSYPVAYKPFMARVRKLFRQDRDKTFTRKIQLDALGVHVWSMIDGKKTVKNLIDAFAADYQVHTKESETSVTLFLKSLGEKGLILIRNP
jgi:hypothetical protein